ncbi:acetyl-CoA carboxylase biotin carboxyl carrier protein [Flavimaricola marinus]|uniref:acetyl-CoA carboxylase biotin carboxyl carrier protein n=1 Tax=Flavimaricola marinus TaxID=1819565 RepID=UPI0014551DBB|nr:acetyl-CoA carboxylase biotin carboxyl carrier protein subunit [Flavimaricola marinus]
MADFEWSIVGERIRIERRTPAQPETASPHGPVTAEPQKNGESAAIAAPVVAPMAGICHFRSDGESEPFVSIGDTIRDGQTVCMIEAMKVMTSITATVAGIVDAILVDDGASVAAGDPLILVRT